MKGQEQWILPLSPEDAIFLDGWESAGYRASEFAKRYVILRITFLEEASKGRFCAHRCREGIAASFRFLADPLLSRSDPGTLRTQDANPPDPGAKFQLGREGLQSLSIPQASAFPLT